MDLQEHRTVRCPVCGAPLTLLLDTTLPRQRYVEDCQVCCRPLVVTVHADAGAITRLDVRPEND